MSQVIVEQVLGRLLTDSEFRDRFFVDSDEWFCQLYSLTETEREALVASQATLSKETLEWQGSRLDPAICRADLRPVKSDGRR